MKSSLDSLKKRIRRATGPDDGIDRAIAARVDGDRTRDAVPPYTASVDSCIALIQRTLPGWHWHVGHGPMGIFPYALMTRNGGTTDPVSVQVTAPTVPLALLGALIEAMDRG